MSAHAGIIANAHHFRLASVRRGDGILWCTIIVVDEIYDVLRFLSGFFLSDSRRDCDRTVSAMIMFGQIHETVNQVLRGSHLNRRKLSGERGPDSSCTFPPATLDGVHEIK